MKLLNLLTILLLLPGYILAQTSIAEKLGYPPDTKLLIIHADDLGVAHSENMASIKAMETGSVNSASIMVPCPWFPEIADYVSQSDGDFGLHLTITSEWDFYKWGPVSSSNLVSSLVNKEGYFYASVDSVRQLAKPEEVAIELRNQVMKALAAGIDVTHLDTHMGALGSTPEIIKVYMETGHEFDLPVLLTPEIREAGFPLSEKDVVVDALYQAYPQVYESGMADYYTNVLKGLAPGLNCLLIHVAYENDEMTGITVNHPGWGANWRQQDFDFFTSPQCAKLLREQNIQLVTWKEIRDKIVRAK